MRKGICFIVPMFNEGAVIKLCLDGFTKAGIPWEDVYLVDDGSKDDTLKNIATCNFPASNVLSMPKNSGKAEAIMTSFVHFGLNKRYEWLNFMDADSVVDRRYYNKAKLLTEEAPEDTLAFCSHVRTKRGVYNIPTAYRVYEYFISHYAYKEAQEYMNTLTVLPGCGSCYRTDILNLLFKESKVHTLTEDMDWTIQTQLLFKGKITYDRDLVVYTQDPGSIVAYTKQVDRWQRGCWQVYLKRRMYRFWEDSVKTELSFLLLEGLTFSTVTLLVTLYALLTQKINYAMWYIIMDAAMFMLVNLIAAIHEDDIRPIVFLSTSYMLRFINCIVFLKAFIQIVILKIDKKGQLSWNKVERY